MTQMNSHLRKRKSLDFFRIDRNILLFTKFTTLKKSAMVDKWTWDWDIYALKKDRASQFTYFRTSV